MSVAAPDHVGAPATGHRSTLRAAGFHAGFVLFALPAFLAPPLPAAYPALSGVFPHAGAPGKTFTVKFTGKLDGTGRRVWCDDPAIVFSLPDSENKSTVSIAPEARPGLHQLRFVNAEGVSEPIRFTVTSLPLSEEKEPNDEHSAPQILSKLPVCVLGQLDKAGDVDCYSVNLRKGRAVFIRVDAYSLGAPVDMHLQILDARGSLLATLSDGRNPDPETVFTPAEDGVYFLRVAGFSMPPSVEVGFTGGPGKPYQLTVSDGPLVTRVFPAAVPVSGKHPVELRGISLGKEGVRAELSATPQVGVEDIGLVMPPGAAAPIDVVRARHPIHAPSQPGAESPFLLPVPSVVGAELDRPGVSANFRVPMKKGEKIRARVWSKSLGLPVDAVLSVKGPTGGAVLLSENSSDMVEEPVLGWSATGDGEYLLSVADLLHRGGPGFEFVLEVAPPRPVCTITLTDAKPVRVEVGKTTNVKAKVTLSGGWTEPLMARILGTPEGVYSPEVTVPEKGGEIELSLHAAANAPAGSAPAGVSLWTKASPPTFVSATFPVRGELRRGHSQSDFAKDFWISVVAPGTPPPPAPVRK